MWGHGYDMGWGMWLAMGLGMVAFWAVILMALRLLFTGRAGGGRRPSDPEHTLKDRLARGEITPEEYEQRRRLIADGR